MFGTHYMLSRQSSAYVRAGPYESREDIKYRNYRKFTAEAAIRFAEPPVPADAQRDSTLDAPRSRQ